MSKILIIAIGAVMLVIAAFLFFDGFNEMQREKAAREFNEKLLEPYKNDNVGGETPEETYRMFLEALRDEDIELASKMFVVEKQGEWLGNFQELEEKDLVQEYVEGFPAWEDLSENDRDDPNFKEFSITRFREESFLEHQGQKIRLPAGDISASILFKKNLFTNKWKINNL